MRIRIILTAILVLTLGVSAQAWILAVKGGKIFTMSNGIIEDGIIIIENNRIAEIGRAHV